MHSWKSKILGLAFGFGILGTISTSSPSTARADTILSAPLISQLPELKNGCEVTSLAMLLQYRGIPVSKMTLASQVAKDTTPYREVGGTIYWGNPNTGFVGDITGNSIGYAVYHGPVYQLASRYTSMVDLTGQSFDTILQQLDRGRPVWVISTSTFDTVPGSQWRTIQTPTGPLSITFHEHSVLLTGYDSQYVYFNDPLANKKNRAVPRGAFIRGWQQFGGQAMTYALSQGVMDTPVSGTVMNGDYNISGWFLDDSGVAKIEVLVDGIVVGEAAYGDARADVQQAYPDYNNGNAGYHYTLNTNGLSDGVHTVSVRETGRNGSVTTLPGASITVSNAKGVMDTPVPNMYIKGIQNISGWFLNRSGTSKVEVLVDGAVIGQASYGDARTDVKKAYPDYNNGNAGYHYALDTAKLSDGHHTIAVRETGRNGLTTTLPAVPVVVANARGCLDNLSSGQTLIGSYHLSGWALADSGVAKVEVLVDGAVVGQAVYGDARADVQKAYPEYNNGSSGYHYALDTTKLTDGNHTISIKQTAVNGQTSVLPAVHVTIANQKGYMDTPTDGAALTGKTNVSGWFLDGAGVAKIEVLVDGTAVGQAVYGDTRTDVKKVYPAYNNGNSGYHYTLDTTTLNDGAHTVAIRETSSNGKTTILSAANVTVSNVVGYLDSPVSGATLSGSSAVSGWFLDQSGVAKIEVLVDGVVVGPAVYGDARADVKNVFPQFNNGKAGYHYALDTTKFANGSHTVTVKETGNNGRTKVLAESVVTVVNGK